MDLLPYKFCNLKSGKIDLDELGFLFYSMVLDIVVTYPTPLFFRLPGKSFTFQTAWYFVRLEPSLIQVEIISPLLYRFHCVKASLPPPCSLPYTQITSTYKEHVVRKGHNAPKQQVFLFLMVDVNMRCVCHKPSFQQ